MNRFFSFRSPQRAFTLIELLVVITIIAVLVGLLLPVGGKIMDNSRKAQAKTMESQIITAITSFKAEYGSYPLPTDAPTGVDTCFGKQMPNEAELFDILQANKQGDEATINPRNIVYIELPKAKNQAPGQSKNGLGADRMLYDPWGTIFLVGVDTNYDGTLPNPYGQNAGPDPLRNDIIVYSWGTDQASSSNFYGNGGDKNTGTCKDDVISWQ